MTTNSESNEPKLVVDEDWKAQVEREKEQLRTKEQSSSPQDRGEKLPPASFSMLVTTYSTQALASLGYLPDPISNEPQINRPLAKHFIDMLAVVEEKTRGNLTKDEELLLSETLHQLRMAFVAPPPKVPPAKADAASKNPTIELP